MKPEPLYQGREIGAELDRIQGRLADLGLFRTMQAVNKAVQALGWELADKLESK
jgi:hypothetical protein